MVKPLSSSASAHGADEAVYGLDQLLELAGDQLGEEITPRTVRLYATEGLIDRPGKDGRRALYSQRHLLQLLLVRTLARRGLSLSAIAPWWWAVTPNFSSSGVNSMRALSPPPPQSQSTMPWPICRACGRTWAVRARHQRRCCHSSAHR